MKQLVAEYSNVKPPVSHLEGSNSENSNVNQAGSQLENTNVKQPASHL